MMQTTTTRARVIPILAWAVLFAALAVGLEAAFHVSLRLPGHRALPGALAMLLMAQAASPRLLVAFSAIVALLLALLPGGSPALIIPWVGLLPLLLLAQRSRYAEAAWLLVALGITFGLFRVGMLWGGFHKAPQLIRIAGHLSFGALGGLLAVGIARLHQRLADKEGP